MNKKKSVYFMSIGNPDEIKIFSGIPYYMYRVLKNRIPGLQVIADPIPKLIRGSVRYIKKILPNSVDISSAPLYNIPFANRIANRIEKDNGILISLINSPIASFISNRVPVIYVSDASFERLSALYEPNGKIHPLKQKWRRQEEAAILSNAVHSSFSSQWAADSAINDFGISAKKISVIPWGCNFDYIPVQEYSPDPNNICRLLLIGIGWHRKGIDIAVETADILNKRGFSVKLDIVGANLPPDVKPSSIIEAHGILKKNIEADAEKLRSLLSGASFLFLPTRADCTPMVFAEGNAFGVPAATWDVGGVTGVVKHGRNGLVSDPALGSAGLADMIEKAWLDKRGYLELRKSSREMYEKVLNWNAWADEFMSKIEFVLK